MLENSDGEIIIHVVGPDITIYNGEKAVTSAIICVLTGAQITSWH